MDKKTQTDQCTLQAASKIMQIAGFDPQSGCGEAFRYVVKELSGLKSGTDAAQDSVRIAGYLSDEFRLQLHGRKVEAAQVRTVLDSYIPA